MPTAGTFYSGKKEKVANWRINGRGQAHSPPSQPLELDVFQNSSCLHFRKVTGSFKPICSLLML